MEFEFNLDWTAVLQFVIAVLLPLLVGLVTTKVTSSNVKAVLLIVLSFIAGLLGEILVAAQAGVPYDLAAGLIAGFTTLIIAIAVHFGVWRPIGATNAAQNALVTPKGDNLN